MADSSFRLNDKTVVMAGPYGLLMQNLTAQLAECGADVAVLTDDYKSAQRVCQNIMDMREVSEKFGRAAAIEVKLHDEKSVTGSLSRAAELFGSTDIYIDAYLFGLKIPFYADANPGPACTKTAIEAQFHTTLEFSKALSQAALTFVKSRARGRLLYLFHELDMVMAERAESNVFIEFQNQIRQMALKYSETQTAVNALAVGVNEEYLLSRFPKTPTIQKALQQLVQHRPNSRLIDYADIAQVVAFLVSPLANGLSGQTIHLNHGV
jgi:3-oxoacyl-[acyl-carrier protein] reductase